MQAPCAKSFFRTNTEVHAAAVVSLENGHVIIFPQAFIRWFYLSDLLCQQLTYFQRAHHSFIHSFSARETKSSPKAKYCTCDKRLVCLHLTASLSVARRRSVWTIGWAVIPSPAESFGVPRKVLDLHVSDPLAAYDRCASRFRCTSIFRSFRASTPF
jgi:hypothetical protein